MPTIRFLEFQAEAVAAGAKRRTIRKPRPLIRAGDALRLTGPRQNPRLLREAVCLSVEPVSLVLRGGRIDAALLGGEPVDDVEAFAVEDGFADAAAMGAFFEALRGPGEFCGVLICW